MLEGVTTMRLDEVGALEAKIRLERDEPNGKFLLYAPTEEPDYEIDWLLDIRLYSRSFRADRASILLQELGLVNFISVPEQRGGSLIPDGPQDTSRIEQNRPAQVAGDVCPSPQGIFLTQFRFFH